jgi:hypothetical protein
MEQKRRTVDDLAIEVAKELGIDTKLVNTVIDHHISFTKMKFSKHEPWNWFGVCKFNPRKEKDESDNT